MNSSDSIIKKAPITVEVWALPQFGQPKELPFCIKNQFIEKKIEIANPSIVLEPLIAKEIPVDDHKVTIQDQLAQEEAIKGAYQKGLNEGKEIALQLTRNQDEEMKRLLNEQTQLTERLGAAFSKGQQKIETLLQESLKKFFHSFLIHSPSDRISWLQDEVNRTLTTNQLLRIYVAPEAIQSWINIWPKFTHNFYPHPDLKEKDCLIEFDAFFLDGRLQTLLEHLCKETTDDDNQLFPSQIGQSDQVSAGGN